MPHVYFNRFYPISQVLQRKRFRERIYSWNTCFIFCAMHLILIYILMPKKNPNVIWYGEQLHCCLKGSPSPEFGSVMHKGNSHAPGIILLCPVLPRAQRPAPTPTDHETRERHAKIRNTHPTVPLPWAVVSLTDTHLYTCTTYLPNGLTGSDRRSQVKLYKYYQGLRGYCIGSVLVGSQKNIQKNHGVLVLPAKWIKYKKKKKTQATCSSSTASLSPHSRCSLKVLMSIMFFLFSPSGSQREQKSRQ